MDISFVRQFVVPVILLVSLIMISSLLMQKAGSETPGWYWQGFSSEPKNIGRFQKQIADLEGESQRLKAFAKKVVKLAKLDEGVFNFDQPPARGGLGGRNIGRYYPSGSEKEMRQYIKALQQQLIQQSNRFERMQLILRSRVLGGATHHSKWPVSTGYISSTFGMRKDPFTGRLRKHNGLDLAGPRGSDIMSIAEGIVIYTGRKGGYGNVIEIKHTNGLVSRYAHLEKSLVKTKQSIAAGEKIARLGTSGRSTGPHLHLEILKNNRPIDPLFFLGQP